MYLMAISCPSITRAFCLLVAQEPIHQLREHSQDKSLFERDMTFSGVSEKKKILADGFKLKGTLTQMR